MSPQDDTAWARLPSPIATRRAEVEALAEKLYVAMWADYPLTQQCDGSFPDDWDVAAWSFNGAEAWLDERDRRRGESK